MSCFSSWIRPPPKRHILLSACAIPLGDRLSTFLSAFHGLGFTGEAGFRPEKGAAASLDTTSHLLRCKCCPVSSSLIRNASYSWPKGYVCRWSFSQRLSHTSSGDLFSSFLFLEGFPFKHYQKWCLVPMGTKGLGYWTLLRLSATSDLAEKPLAQIGANAACPEWPCPLQHVAETGLFVKVHLMSA